MGFTKHNFVSLSLGIVFLHQEFWSFLGWCGSSLWSDYCMVTLGLYLVVFGNSLGVRNPQNNCPQIIYLRGGYLGNSPLLESYPTYTLYHLREQNVALPRLDSWWSSPSRLYLSSKELESSHQQHTFKYQMFHPLLFIFWFALNVPEVMCRTRCEHLVVSLSNHSFLPPIFKWFFHCIVHQVRFFSSFCPWVVTLHLKPAFGSYKDSPVSLCAWWGNDDLTWCCAK